MAARIKYPVRIELSSIITDRAKQSWLQCHNAKVSKIELYMRFVWSYTSGTSYPAPLSTNQSGSYCTCANRHGMTVTRDAPLSMLVRWLILTFLVTMCLFLFDSHFGFLDKNFSLTGMSVSRDLRSKYRSPRSRDLSQSNCSWT